MRKFGTPSLLLLALGFGAPSALTQTSEAGRVHYAQRMDPSFDRYVQASTLSAQQWLRDHYVRLGVFTPFFDNKLSWFANAWVYINLYAIYPDSAIVAEHPEWILKDGKGNRLYIPWNCSGGTCPQFAGDVGSPEFRRWWINQAKKTLAKGYKGAWIDDVNLMFRVSDGNQVEVAPIDQRTGATMTFEDWRKYVAEFTEQIRAELPGFEILHNSIWFAGPGGVRDRDPYIQRQIAAADFINIERGISDDSLTGDASSWSLQELMSFIDRVHARGRSVVFDEIKGTNREYALAGYFAISNDKDMIGDFATSPDNWWAGYDITLGKPKGARYDWSGLIRRDFDGGMILMNLPGAATKTVSLPGTFRTVSNEVISKLTLPGKTGAVLRLVALLPEVSKPPTSDEEYQLSAMTWNSAKNGYGPVERDLSNGENGTADGSLLRLGGVSYSRGLGVHADSDVRYDIGGSCTTFQAVIGIDDETQKRGSAIFQVFADGVKLYESAVLTGTSGPALMKVSVAGKYELRLVVTDAGDGKDFDHADWANARLSCEVEPPANIVVTVSSLSDRIWTYGTSGWGPVEKDKSNGERPLGDGSLIRLNGVAYTKGLGVHAPSEIHYSLAAACVSLAADVGLDDEVGWNGSVVFEVWADNSKLFDSGVMYGSSITKSFNVDLTGKNELRLLVRDAGNGTSFDHADWANAQITCR